MFKDQIEEYHEQIRAIQVICHVFITNERHILTLSFISIASKIESQHHRHLASFT